MGATPSAVPGCETGCARVAQQGHQQNHPAQAKHTHQPQPCGSARPWAAGAQRRHIKPRAGRHGLVRRLAYTEQPQCGNGHSRAARSGSRMRVRCHCQPARLVILHPCSIQARSPYQAASLASGGRSVSISQGSFYASSHSASSVHSTCRPAFCKAVP
jgi:hypothetical protein